VRARVLRPSGVPWRLGEWWRFEFQIAVGSGVALHRQYTVASTTDITSGGPVLTWAALSASPSVRLYFSEHFALAVEANINWVPFVDPAGPEGRFNFAGALQVGITYSP
jgi:hypothetical protein